MMAGLDDKVTLVTGGASGIGRATALAFAKQGAKVAIADIDADGGQQTVQLVEADGGTAMFVAADVTKSSDVEAMVDKVARAWGSLEVAFNNAGGSRGPRVPTHEYLDDDWNWVIDVNLKGVWLCMKHEIRRMLKQGHGAIVNMSSIMGLYFAWSMVLKSFCSSKPIWSASISTTATAVGIAKTPAVCAHAAAAKTTAIEAMIPTPIRMFFVMTGSFRFKKRPRRGHRPNGMSRSSGTARPP